MELDSLKILIISNNPVNLNNSNGRTIYNLFSFVKKENIFNFYINGVDSLLSKENCFSITDSEALCLFLKKQYKNNTNSIVSKQVAKHKKTFLKILFREKIWNNSVIYKKILDWTRKVKPNLVIFQAGDNIFMTKICRKLVNDLKLNLIIYNSEEYFFKNYNYIKKTLKQDYLYKKWIKKFKIEYSLLNSLSSYNIYLTDDLEEKYSSFFVFEKNCVIYNSSSLSKKQHCPFSNKNFIYSGNLGVGRIDSLILIGKIIKQIDPNYSLNIYGKANDDELQTLIKNKEFVNYCSYVSYEENLEIIKNAFCNVHVDSFNDFYKRDCKYAFSTKIPDLLSTGQNLLLFSPTESSLSLYFKKYKCGFVANNMRELETSIRDIISGESNRYLANAFAAVKQNHSLVKNQKKVKKIIENVNEKKLFEILVTTMNRNYDEMIQLIKKMNIQSDVIIRSQNGKSGIKKVKFKNFNATLIYANDAGLSKNRNELFKQSNAEYVLFSDDDEVFSNGYYENIENSLKNKPEAVEFSWIDLFNSKSLIFKQEKRNHRSYSGFGLWALIISSSFIKQYNLQQDENFGAGTPYSCGEDTIFRRMLYKLSSKVYCSPFVLITMNNGNSTSFNGATQKYIEGRSKVYGYLHPFLYPIFIFRMRFVQRSRGVKGNYFKLLRYGQQGKKYFFKKYKIMKNCLY